MNQNITQHNFSDGMANIPSDSICSDNSLAAEWNMIFKNGEHHVIRDPLPLYDGSENTHPYVLYIHKTGGIENAITLYNEKLSWLPYDVLETNNTELPSISELNLTPQSIKGITSIGNTLIVSVKLTYEIEVGKWKHVNRLYYFLWKNDLNNYIFLGNQLPKPDVRFALNAHRHMIFSEATFSNTTQVATSTADTGDMISVDDSVNVNIKKQEDYNNLIVGLYEKNKRSISQKKAFHSPFFVRYALELFDGSYARISAPILLFPSIRRNSYAEMWNFCKLHTTYAYLFYKNLVKIENWSDIVKGIAVFVSKQIDVYETAIDQDSVKEYTSGQTLADGIFRSTTNTGTLSPFTDSEQFYDELTLPSNTSNFRFFSCLKQKEEAEILNELKSTSIFYKLFNIPLEATSNYVLSNDKFQTHDLENVVTLPQLDHDDYFGNCYLSSDVIYMYNRRLHLANVTRGFFEGHSSLIAFDYKDSTGRLNTIDLTAFVTIRTSNGDKIVRHDFTTSEVQDFYFYYPDPRAYLLKMYQRDGTTIKQLFVKTLKAHPLLNGAYYMADTLPTANRKVSYLSTSATLDTESSTPETLPNEVWQSEVNNPFVFNASGVITVGNGTIQSIISNTVALSQGQFGQFPLFVFTTEGIWTLQTSSTGTYSAAHPMSREICNNKNTIVATDQLVFFSSTKGLMMINGSQVTCVSTQMAGNTFDPTGDDAKLFFDYDVNPQMNFIEYLETCRIAYDYTESLLWIVNSKMPQCFVYSIESGAISIKTLLYPIDNVINNYPDNLLLYHNEISDVEHEYYLASLLLRQNLNNDMSETSAFLISRPLKIEDATALKSLVEHKLIYNANPNSQARIRVFGSDNMKDWSRINSFFGRGFKYFKYQLIFDKLIPTDTFSGIVAKWKTKFQRRFR